MNEKKNNNNKFCMMCDEKVNQRWLPAAPIFDDGPKLFSDGFYVDKYDCC